MRTPNAIGRGIVGLALLFAAMSPAIASAQQDPHDPRNAAEAHYQAAVRLFGEGRYREALDEFDVAIELSPEPVFYCNRAVVLIKLEESLEALQSLETCRDTFAGDPVELAQIDAQASGVGAFVRHVGPSATRVAQRVASEGVSVAPRDDGWGLSDVGYLSLGAGAAVLASAATLDLLSEDLRADFEAEASGEAGTSYVRYRELRDEFETRQAIFAWLTIGGLALAITGVSLVTYDLIVGEESVEVVLSPRLGASGAGAELLLRF